MTVQYIALSLALLLAVVAVVAFIWATKARQRDMFQCATPEMPQDDHVPEGPKSTTTLSASERQHRELLASTHAETPRARSRASISDGQQPDSARAFGRRS